VRARQAGPTSRTGKTLLSVSGVLVVLLFYVSMAQAQASVWQVFLERGDNTDTLSFVSLTGEPTTQIEIARGERHTVMDQGVLYWSNGEALYATPEETEPHPFIQADGAQRVEWVLSPDGAQIAWTQTTTNAGQLTTVTRAAAIDGSDARIVFQDGPRPGVRAQPVAFGATNDVLYMDYQPDGLAAATPYSEYAGLFAVPLDGDGPPELLPDEPGCYCGAGFGNGRFLRLTVSEGAGAFGLTLQDLFSGTSSTIEPLPLGAFTQGGDVLLSPDGTRAVYALAQSRDFGTPAQTVRSVYVRVDLDTRTQEQITVPQTLYLRPVTWTENSSAVLMTSPVRPGTWKLDVQTGRLDLVAEATYIGRIGG